MLVREREDGSLLPALPVLPWRTVRAGAVGAAWAGGVGGTDETGGLRNCRVGNREAGSHRAGNHSTAARRVDGDLGKTNAHATRSTAPNKAPNRVHCGLGHINFRTIFRMGAS